MNTQVLANLDKMIDGVTAAAPRAGAADAS
jgi:hypothetical protein